MAKPKKTQIPVYNAEIGTSGRKWLEVIQQGGDEVQRRRAGQILELLAAGDSDTAVYLAIMLGQRDGLQGFFHGPNRKLYFGATKRWWEQKKTAAAKGTTTHDRVHQLWQRSFFFRPSQSEASIRHDCRGNGDQTGHGAKAPIETPWHSLNECRSWDWQLSFRVIE